MSYKPGPDEITDLTDFSILRGIASIKLIKPISQLIVIPPPRTDTLNGIEFITIGEYIENELNDDKDIVYIIKNLKKRRFKINDIIFSYIDYKVSINNLNLDQNFISNITSSTDPALQSHFKDMMNSKNNVSKSDATVLDFVNSYRKIEDDKIFDDADEAMQAYRIWSVENYNIVLADQKILQEKFMNRRELENVHLLRQSPIFVKKIIIEANPIVDSDLDPRDALTLFNKTEVSKFVPFIQYNGSEQNYYKIWTGSKSRDETPNYGTIIQDLFNIKTHHIYMVLWVGDPNKEDISNATRKSFKLVIYDLINNIIRFEIPAASESKINNDQEIISRVKDGLKLDFKLLNNNQISGEFFVWSVPSFNEVTFLDYTTVDPVINSMLYYSESRKPYPLKSRYEFYFKEEVHNSFGGSNIQTKISISSLNVTEGITPKYILNGNVKNINVVPSTVPPLDDNIQVGTPYLQVRITSSSITEAERFSRIFNQIIGYINYKEKTNNIIGIYITLLNDNPMLLSSARKSDISRNLRTGVSRGRQDKDSKLTKLKSVAEDIFQAPYARSVCPRERHPTLVASEDFVSVNSSSVLGHLKGRSDVQVLAFPKPSKAPDGTLVPPRLYFRCNDNIAKPFPGVAQNKGMIQNGYKYLPCCWAEDQVNDPTSKYQSYYHNYVKEKPAPATAYATDKFASPGQTGSLPPVLSNLLSKYSENSGKLLRSGTIISPNSIIHVLLEAIHDNNYISLQPERREPYVRGIRTLIYKTINPDVLKQELYDWPDDEIRREFLNTHTFFDPYLFYRALEETFNVNIYVFAVDKHNRSKKGEIKASDVKLDIPRHKIFHTRLFRPERQTVLIYKHSGSESNAAEFPQCELIIEGPKTTPGSKTTSASTIKNRVTLFGLDMNTFIYKKIYLNSHSVITWSFDNVIDNMGSSPSSSMGSSISQPLQKDDTDNNQLIEARVNLYNMFNYKFDNTTHQFIDAYGKMRGLIFDNISVFFPPTQPVNLPQSMSQTVAPLATILDKFDPAWPGYISVEKSKIVGVWYSIYDISQGIYVSVDPVEIDDPSVPDYIKKLPRGDSHPMESVQNSLALRFKKMEKTVNVFLQTLIWLYQMFERNLLSDNPDPTILTRCNGLAKPDYTKEKFRALATDNKVRLFANCYFILGNDSPVNDIEDLDTSEIYNVDNIPHKLWPDSKSLDDALDKLRLTGSRIVVTDGNNLNIYFYDKWFLAKMIYRLTRFINSINTGLQLEKIVNVFQSINDFNQQSETIIIVGEIDFKEWISYQQRLKSKFEEVHKKLGIEYRFKINPYIYRDPVSEQYYIVQNVVKNDKARALAVAQKWKTLHLNPGPAVEQMLNIDSPDLKYVVYGIAANNGHLFVRENKTDNSTDYLELLEYGRRDISGLLDQGGPPIIINEYAAMLPIPNPIIEN